jgi:hypothetical protein
LYKLFLNTEILQEENKVNRGKIKLRKKETRKKTHC